MTVRHFKAGDEEAFRALNEAWIRQWFAVEPKDLEVLGAPCENIIEPGGAIFMAEEDGQAVGCCALLRRSDSEFEIGKMAVAEACRGKGCGGMLLTRAIEFARANACKRLYLESSHKLPSAIRLYERAGFTHVPAELVQPSPYSRSDVYMELHL